MGNHTPGHNHESLSVCLIGGLDEQGSVDEQGFTQEQWETLAYLIAMARVEWPDIKVVRRYDIQKRKGDIKRQSITPEATQAALEMTAKWPEGLKPISEVIRVRPSRPRIPKDVTRDPNLDP